MGSGKTQATLTLATPIESGSQVRSVEVEVDSVLVHPSLKPRDGSGLVESIRVDGLINALTARELPDGRVEVVAGSRRLDAVRKLNHRTVRCDIRQMTDTEAKVLALEENLNRKDLKPVEEARMMNELLNEGWDKERIAKRCDRDATSVHERLRLLQLPEKIQVSVDRGEIPVEMAQRALSLLVKHPKLIDKVVRQYKEQPPDLEESVRLAKRELKDAEDQEKLKALLEKAKHPNCPICGTTAIALSYNKDLPWVRCEKYHEFNTETGKVPKEYEWQLREKGRKAKAAAKAGALPISTIKSKFTVAEIRHGLTSWALRQKTFYRISGPGFDLSLSGDSLRVEVSSSLAEIEAYKYDTGEHTKIEVDRREQTAEGINRDLKKISDFLDEALGPRKRRH